MKNDDFFSFYQITEKGNARRISCSLVIAVSNSLFPRLRSFESWVRVDRRLNKLLALPKGGRRFFRFASVDGKRNERHRNTRYGIIASFYFADSGAQITFIAS